MTVLFGGAFDPPHLGHVALLAAARVAFSPERVVVLVIAAPGHKPVHADARSRLALARAAFPGESVKLDHHARTVELLRERRFPDPLLLLGADELLDFQAWKDSDEVLELARLAVAMRPGYEGRESEAKTVLSRLRHPERVAFFELEPVDASSSEVRARVAAGEPIADLVPAAVAHEIAGGGLYAARLAGESTGKT